MSERVQDDRMLIIELSIGNFGRIVRARDFYGKDVVQRRIRKLEMISSLVTRLALISIHVLD